MGNTKTCTRTVRAGRLAKARQFQRAAAMLAAVGDDDAIGDAYVTLCIHAGIAAADVICCTRLGEYHRGDDHHGAITLLSKVDRAAARCLRTLLDLKSRSGYGAALISDTDQKRAARAAESLLRSAETT
jgi:hypothetical protein